MSEKRVVIIGAGPAGLTAAHELTKHGISGVVFEKDDVVGGISRTVERDGYRFDIGGHRFFTKVSEVEDLWHEMIGEDFITRPRLSRIYYSGKFFYYPLRAMNALRNLGIFEAFLCVLSYLKAKIFKRKSNESFEDYIVNNFGERLYKHFFKTYTEKVWGIPCTEIRAEWAAQRIQGLSLWSAVVNAVFKPKGQGIKTLIEEFEYPVLGPGMMWEKFKAFVEAKGIPVHMETDVTKIHWEPGKVTGVTARHADGTEKRYDATDVISTMPIQELIAKMDPPVSADVAEAGKGLKYRDFLTVALVVDEEHLFDDNWIYVHSPDVKLGRIQNFKNWSPALVPDPSKSCLGLEYFVFEGDELWNSADEDLIALGEKEMVTLGLIKENTVEKGYVVRIPKAYPTYDADYSSHIKILREFLDSLPNLHPVGRNGMHKYNNQDHSMLTAMLAVRNIDGANFDVWEVNVEDEYHEAGASKSAFSEPPPEGSGNGHGDMAPEPAAEADGEASSG